MDTVDGTVYLEALSSFQYLDRPGCESGEVARFDPIVWYVADEDSFTQQKKPFNGFIFAPTMEGRCYYSAEGFDIAK